MLKGRDPVHEDSDAVYLYFTHLEAGTLLAG